MARPVVKPKIQKINNPPFYEDSQGWPFKKGDIVIAFCPYTGESEDCRVISLGEGTYDPLTLVARGEVTLKQANCPHGNCDVEWIFEYDSDACLLIQGHPDNKDLFMREQFEEYRSKAIAEYEELDEDKSND